MCTPLILVLARQRRVELCEFEGSLGYIVSLKPYEETLPQKIDNKT